MKRLDLAHAGGQCRVLIGAGLLARPEAWAGLIDGRCLIVTDATVGGLYLERLCLTLRDFAPETLVLEPGEAFKTASSWMRIVEHLAAIGAQRDATVIALGGGVVGDLAGFAAASYMRGIRVVQAPTTLLAQVDAAIGGKTGFNLAAGKNLVGAFHQPAAVIADVDTLASLPARDFAAGMAEVIKYGAIRDAAFLDALERDGTALQALRADALEAAVAGAAAHKIDVVAADEREAGGRALLNFGHTFGHAIEAETGYRRYRHGEAVAIGMHLAARTSVLAGMLTARAAARLDAILRQFDLPLAPPDDIDAAALVERMRLDKKNRAGRLRLILLERLGRAVIRDDIEPAVLLETLTR